MIMIIVILLSIISLIIIIIIIIIMMTARIERRAGAELHGQRCVGRLSYVCLCASCLLNTPFRNVTRVSPEIQQNFTRISPEFRQNIELEHLKKGDNHDSVFPHGGAWPNRGPRIGLDSSGTSELRELRNLGNNPELRSLDSVRL